MPEAATITQSSHSKHETNPVQNGGDHRLPVVTVDDFLDDEQRKRIYAFLCRPTWQFGWKSVAGQDQYSFWHKHFAGHKVPDHTLKADQEQPYDCAEELQGSAPIIHRFWQALEMTALKGHTLLRCYANGQPFGSEGAIHTDSISERSFTSIYYPHEKWHPNWGGETVFFNKQETDIIASIYPKPNRFVVFAGTTPHVARGVARVCPALRITLMFKTEMNDGGG
jgi:SM-20-related protein